MANPNEPAAPVAQGSEAFIHATSQSAGLSKRETAAIAAMQGLLAASNDGSDLRPRELASDAVQFADALFAALAAGGDA